MIPFPSLASFGVLLRLPLLGCCWTTPSCVGDLLVSYLLGAAGEWRTAAELLVEIVQLEVSLGGFRVDFWKARLP